MPWQKRTTAKWLLISIAITVGVTFVLWSLLGTRGLFFGFLFLPFLGLGRRLVGGTRDQAHQHLRTPGVRTCPRCGFQSGDRQDSFCRRDGARLV